MIEDDRRRDGRKKAWNVTQQAVNDVYAVDQQEVVKNLGFGDGYGVRRVGERR